MINYIRILYTFEAEKKKKKTSRFINSFLNLKQINLHNICLKVDKAWSHGLVKNALDAMIENTFSKTIWVKYGIVFRYTPEVSKSNIHSNSFYVQT